MPFLDHTDDIIAQLTNAGRNAYARSIIPAEAFSFKLVGFKVGRSGYLETNPVKIISIDPTDTSLIDPVFPVVGIQPFETVEQIISPEIIAPICRLSPTDFDADYGLGELGIYAEIVRSVDPDEVGDLFLYAIVHFPLMSKTQSHTLVWRIIIAL